MLKNFLICFITIVFICACNRVEKKEIKAPAIKNKQEHDTLQVLTKNTVYFDYSNTTIKEEFNDSLFTKFSDSLTDDKFTFYVPKGNINNTTSVLKIFNTTGDLIGEKSFKTNNLINGYDLEYIKSDEELEKYILTRAKEILNKDSFVDISDKNEMEKDPVFGDKESFENYDTFIECQNKKRPLYSIFLGEEDTEYFGYSDKLKKVVYITGCC